MIHNNYENESTFCDNNTNLFNDNNDECCCDKSHGKHKKHHNKCCKKYDKPCFKIKRLDIKTAKRLAHCLGIRFRKVKFTPKEFLLGIRVELEHGRIHMKTNITNNNIYVTAKIALAHLNENAMYYNKYIGLEAFEHALHGVKKDAKKVKIIIVKRHNYKCCKKYDRSRFKVKRLNLKIAKKLAHCLGVRFHKVKFTPKQFLSGIRIELEHGRVHMKTNVTNNNIYATAKLTLAHLNKNSMYYNKYIGLKAFENAIRRFKGNPCKAKLIIVKKCNYRCIKKYNRSRFKVKRLNLKIAKRLAHCLGVRFRKVKFTPKQFLSGIRIELEHGRVHKRTNVTNNNIYVTAKLTLAHLNKNSMYYNRHIGLRAFEKALHKFKGNPNKAKLIIVKK